MYGVCSSGVAVPVKITFQLNAICVHHAYSVSHSFHTGVLYPFLAVIFGNVIASVHTVCCGFPLYVTGIVHVSEVSVTSSTLLSVVYVAVYVFSSDLVCAYNSTSLFSGIVIVTPTHAP